MFSVLQLTVVLFILFLVCFSYNYLQLYHLFEIFSVYHCILNAQPRTKTAN